MHLDSFLICDAADATGGKLFLMGAGLTRVTAQSMPFLLPQLVIVARFRLDDDDEQDRPDTIGLTMTTPGGGSIIDQQWPEQTRTPSNQPFAEGEERYANLVIAFGPVQFEEYGAHVVRLHLNRECVRESRLVVVQPS